MFIVLLELVQECELDENGCGAAETGLNGLEIRKLAAWRREMG